MVEKILRKHMIWQILGKLQKIQKLINILKQLYLDTFRILKLGSLLTETIRNTNGLEPGCTFQ